MKVDTEKEQVYYEEYDPIAYSIEEVRRNTA